MLHGWFVLAAVVLSAVVVCGQSDKQANPWPIVDTPNDHGMFMLGTTVIYLCHMPIFWKEDHHYQLTLQVHLDAASTQLYLSAKRSWPDAAFNLINNVDFTLPDLVSGAVTNYPATIHRGYSNAGGGTPGPVVTNTSTVYVDRVVYWRAFDANVPRPVQLAYVLFGNADEAFIDHYIAADPDYQHLVQLTDVPTWLSLAQLQAGVVVAFQGHPTRFACRSQLADGATYQVLFQGIATAPAQLSINRTVWFSAGNLLNAEFNPCP